jgi:hypothetical protein
VAFLDFSKNFGFADFEVEKVLGKSRKGEFFEKINR